MTTNLRGALAADTELGTGNALVKLLEHGVDPGTSALGFDTDVDGHPAWQPLTLGEVRERVAARAAWLRDHGIKPRDPVAIYVTRSADVLLNFMAATWIGAIPALMNGNMPGDIAAGFIQRLGAVGALTDAAHRERLGDRDLGCPLLPDVSETGSGDPAAAPPHYRHHNDDPVAITHSSGTTRTPAAVVHTHASLFAATRLVHLARPASSEAGRTLCVLPAAHTAGVISLQQGLCNGHVLLFLSMQGGTFGQTGPTVIDAIERFRPTDVYGFAVTWADLAGMDLGARDLDSVGVWFNTGDCAHEAHIRPLVAVGSHLTFTREGVKRVKGSKFIDGIGSSEMGHSAFHIAHRLGSDRYNRCVGKPYDFAEIALLDTETGQEVPDGQVGHTALKAPTLSPGYWNDSLNTYRNRLNGYYLTGDLMYRDSEGYYYHVDRAVDAVDLGDGNWLYTALSEDRILARCPGVRDCTVVAGRRDGEVITDVLLMLYPGHTVEDYTPAVKEALGGPAAATLQDIVEVPEDEIVIGPTGKVRKFLMRQRQLALMTTR
jgi:acyl-coenzyme A synthetase/AMP-(fatty) acid ligase